MTLYAKYPTKSVKKISNDVFKRPEQQNVKKATYPESTSTQYS